MVWKKAYKGPHTLIMARKLSKGLKNPGRGLVRLKTKVKKSKGGYYIYYK